MSGSSLVALVCAVALVSCALALEREGVCRCTRVWLVLSRALVVVVVMWSRVTTERNASINVDGETNVDARSNVERVAFSNACPIASTWVVLELREF